MKEANRQFGLQKSKYKCDMCEFETNDEEGLVGHMEKRHTKKILWNERTESLKYWIKKREAKEHKPTDGEISAFIDGWEIGYVKGKQ